MPTCPKPTLPAAMKHSLYCHPAGPCAFVQTVEASARLAESGGLAVSYRLFGDPGNIRIPEPAPPAAADELWRHTCLEAFIAAVDGLDYREFNFSPSGQWANYRFTGCRARDFSFMPPATPRFTFRRFADGFQLDALLAPELLPPSAIFDIGLSAVIEAGDGGKSYWALTHCAPQPDFHLRQSFSLTLQRPTP